MSITTKNVLYTTKNLNIQYNVFSIKNKVYYRLFVQTLKNGYPQFFFNVDNLVDKM